MHLGSLSLINVPIHLLKNASQMLRGSIPFSCKLPIYFMLRATSKIVLIKVLQKSAGIKLPRAKVRSWCFQRSQKSDLILTEQPMHLSFDDPLISLAYEASGQVCNADITMAVAQVF